jgi:hypothetical protein
MLDGNAVRFTNFEAWWLLDGAWRPISPREVLSNAAVMREARFKERFPQVPIRNSFSPARGQGHKSRDSVQGDRTIDARRLLSFRCWVCTTVAGFVSGGGRVCDGRPQGPERLR